VGDDEDIIPVAHLGAMVEDRERTR
jgi:hypothetical protein